MENGEWILTVGAFVVVVVVFGEMRVLVLV